MAGEHDYIDTDNKRDRLSILLNEHYKNVDFESNPGLAKLAFIDTNESLGKNLNPSRNLGVDNVEIDYVQDFSTWKERQEGIEKGSLDGGIIGVGAGNIFNMLDIYSAIQENPDAVPECLIGIDVEPRVVLAGEMIRILAKEVAEGKRTKEDVIKLLFGTDDWDEESQKILGIGSEGGNTKPDDDLENILRRALNDQPDAVKGFFEESDAYENTLREFRLLRKRGDEASVRSIKAVVQNDNFESWRGSLSVAASLYRNFDKLAELASRDRLHFVYGSIKDPKILGVISQAYPSLVDKNNLLYETNVLNVIERHLSDVLIIPDERELAALGRQLLHFHELEKIFNRSGKSVHVYTNSAFMSLPNGRKVSGYELMASAETPRIEFTDFPETFREKPGSSRLNPDW